MLSPIKVCFIRCYLGTLTGFVCLYRGAQLIKLMRCAIELLDKTSDNGFEEIISAWNRKSRRIATDIDWRSNYAFTTYVVCI